MSCNPRPRIEIYNSITDLAQAVARDFEMTASSAELHGKTLSVALAGGATPKGVYQQWARPPFCKAIPWNRVHLFWGDERCVPRDDPESNYRMVHETLIRHVSLPEENIHRIRGEADPEKEAFRYAREIKNHFGGEGLPRFDWIFLGLGTDGHTASLFPGVNPEPVFEGICGVSVHPEDKKKRVTLTLDVLNRATRVAFIVTGEVKSARLAAILSGEPESRDLPAALVRPQEGKLQWYIDKKAAAGGFMSFG